MAKRAGTKDASGEPPDPASIERLHVWQIQAVRDVLFVAAVVGIVWAGYALRAVTVPLLVALLLAYLFEPLIAWLCEHRGIRRPVAIGGLLAAAGVVLFAVGAIALPLAIGQTTRFVDDVQSGALRERIARLETHVPAAYRDDFDSFLDILPAGPADAGAAPEQGPNGEGAAPAGVAGGDGAGGPGGAGGAGEGAVTEDRVRALVEERVRAELDLMRRELAGDAGKSEPQPRWVHLAQGGLDAIARVLGTIVQVGLLAFLIPFYFFFFSLWYPAVLRHGRELIPEKNREHTLELLKKMDRVVAGFVRGRIVISLIMGALLAIGWMICGVPYAIPLGLLVGVFCAVPYLGAIGIPLAVGLLFFERLGEPGRGDLWWVWVLLWPTVVFIIVQTIEGYALTPMIAGKVTNLDPVTIIVAVLAGGSVLGVYGMLLAIPVAACVKILFMEVLMPQVHAWTRGEAADPLPIDRD